MQPFSYCTPSLTNVCYTASVSLHWMAETHRHTHIKHTWSPIGAWPAPCASSCECADFCGKKSTVSIKEFFQFKLAYSWWNLNQQPFQLRTHNLSTHQPNAPHTKQTWSPPWGCLTSCVPFSESVDLCGNESTENVKQFVAKDNGSLESTISSTRIILQCFNSSILQSIYAGLCSLTLYSMATCFKIHSLLLISC